MISSLDGSSQLFLADLNQVQQRLAKINREITSGKQINQASDAPDQVESVLQLRADQQHNQQIQANLALAETSAQTADDALAAAIQLMDRAVTLAARGATSTTDTAGRQSLAQEVQALQSQMVAYSRTAVQGRYIFSGDNPQTPVYSYDAAGTNGVDQLSNVSGTVLVEHPAGGAFLAAKTATEIFDQRNPDGTVAAGNVFAALNSLETALVADDPTAVAQATGALKSASEHLNSMQAFYGAVETRIQDAQTFAKQYDTQLQTQLSQKEDADVPGDALALNQSETHLQAAFQMQAAMPRKSLFDYLA
jgi:flagellar hook-associated protein 3 FlgL